MRTQFTSYLLAGVGEPEQLAFHQWLTQTAHSHKLFSVLRNEGSLTASYGSMYDALVQQNVRLLSFIGDLKYMHFVFHDGDYK